MTIKLPGALSAPPSLTIEEALRHAIVYHQSGQLVQAEATYRAILNLLPMQPDANHNLGVLAVQVGKISAALPLFKTALENQPEKNQFWVSYLEALIRAEEFETASVVLKQAEERGLPGDSIDKLARQLSEADQSRTSRKTPHTRRKPTRKNSVLAPWLKKTQPGILSNKAKEEWVALFNSQQFSKAMHQAKKMTIEFPFDGFGWKGLGAAHQSCGEYQEALLAMQKALSLLPDDIEIYNNLGVIAHGMHLLDEAENYFLHALKLNNAFPDAHYNLGTVLKDKGLFGKAEASLRHALSLRNDYFEAYSNLGYVLSEQDRLHEAEASFRRATTLKPDLAVNYYNLANVLAAQERFSEAEACHRHALDLSPEDDKILNNLGSVLHDLGNISEAELLTRRSVALNPTSANAINNLGNIMKDKGALEEAESFYRQAINLQESEGQTRPSNLLLACMYSEKKSIAATFCEHEYYGRKISKSVLGKTQNSVHKKYKSDVCLRIGFVSADLRRHAITYFLKPLLAILVDHNFELFAYSNSKKNDHITEEVKVYFTGWRETFRQSDGDVVTQILADGIDILIDLSGHTAGNRLPVFACKPAPVQVTWLGYPATTGVPGMDWRITDVHAEPEGLTEHLNTEKLWRLPEIFCCYQPSPNSPEPLPGLPCETLSPAERVQGLPPELAQAVDPAVQVITLGCFNNFAKVTPPVIALWSRILSRLPQARLLLEIHGGQDPQFTADVRQRFVQAGARPEQIHIVPRKPEHQYALYRQLDLALDPFPCTGGTTSCDSLWMGVPFVTLAGEWFVGRMGVTLLHNAGLDELIAHSTAEYADKVVALVNDLPRLRTIRHGLRERVAASPIMDSARFGQHFAQALRGMWAASSGQTSSAPPL